MSGKGFFFREPKTACQVDFSRILTPVCQNKSKGKKKGAPMSYLKGPLCGANITNDSTPPIKDFM